ncbi:hypothetical protein NDU88_005598 [Pleurodeles waltl]|uniref:Uncharacterized protein n=1 Tax=Pleurodeles waltl TaxID=8319 RepID=A0AAV7MWX5_PLEWA|nr:hypothetical protein NDU88_005598 [Pleurodeles waltl]
MEGAAARKRGFWDGLSGGEPVTPGRSTDPKRMLARSTEGEDDDQDQLDISRPTEVIPSPWTKCSMKGDRQWKQQLESVGRLRAQEPPCPGAHRKKMNTRTLTMGQQLPRNRAYYCL